MKLCPTCKRQLPESAKGCPTCGAVFLSAGPAQRSGLRLLVMIVLGLLGGLIVVGACWYFKISPRLKAIQGEPEKSKPMEAGLLEIIRNPQSDFDRTLPLPGDPLGIAWNGEFIIGNRLDPWGYLRVKPAGGSFYEVQKVPVTEPSFGQKVSFSAVTWNGKEYVGYADGGFFQSAQKNVFTIHDPKTLSVLKHDPAPELIGCLVWDGTGYWAATRRNTPDSGEPAFLYRLDENLNIIHKSEPPDIGCQGLAWDGSFLWFADVFSDNIYLLETDGDEARTVHTYQTSFDYLSGIVYDGSHIWITEYDGKKLHRLNPKLRALWAGGDREIEAYAEAGNYLRSSPEAVEEEAVLEGGNSDRYTGSASPPYAGDQVEVAECSVEVTGNALYASWNIYFGSDLFSSGPAAEEGAFTFPTFAKYTFTVRGGDLEAPVVKEYDAVDGENIVEGEEFVSNLGAGTYQVELFIHVQYVDQEGTNRIVNESIPTLEVRND